jgi:hypothetical protein
MTPLILAAKVFLSAAAAAPPKWETVYGLARVNAASKKVDGTTYHLVAVYYNPLVGLLATDATDIVWLVNGKAARDWEVPAEPQERLRGKEDIRIRLTWMRLPEKGDVEILLGAVHFDKPDLSPAEMRKQMIDGNFVPYTVRVGRIPSVKVSTAKELAEAVEKLFGKR